MPAPLRTAARQAEALDPAASTYAGAERQGGPRHDTGAPGQAVLTIDEAACLLRVNRKTLYDAVRMGQVPGVVRLGRTIRIGRTALLSWVQGNGGPALGEHR